jgi:hypothetical protein
VVLLPYTPVSYEAFLAAGILFCTLKKLPTIVVVAPEKHLCFWILLPS